MGVRPGVLVGGYVHPVEIDTLEMWYQIEANKACLLSCVPQKEYGLASFYEVVQAGIALFNASGKYVGRIKDCFRKLFKDNFIARNGKGKSIKKNHKVYLTIKGSKFLDNAMEKGKKFLKRLERLPEDSEYFADSFQVLEGSRLKAESDIYSRIEKEFSAKRPRTNFESLFWPWDLSQDRNLRDFNKDRECVGISLFLISRHGDEKGRIEKEEFDKRLSEVLCKGTTVKGSKRISRFLKGAGYVTLFNGTIQMTASGIDYLHSVLKDRIVSNKSKIEEADAETIAAIAVSNESKDQMFNESFVEQLGEKTVENSSDKPAEDFTPEVTMEKRKYGKELDRNSKTPLKYAKKWFEVSPDGFVIAYDGEWVEFPGGHSVKSKTKSKGQNSTHVYLGKLFQIGIVGYFLEKKGGSRGTSVLQRVVMWLVDPTDMTYIETSEEELELKAQEVLAKFEAATVAEEVQEDYPFSLPGLTKEDLLKVRLSVPYGDNDDFDELWDDFEAQAVVVATVLLHHLQHGSGPSFFDLPKLFGEAIQVSNLQDVKGDLQYVIGRFIDGTKILNKVDKRKEDSVVFPSADGWSVLKEFLSSLEQPEKTLEKSEDKPNDEPEPEKPEQPVSDLQVKNGEVEISFDVDPDDFEVEVTDDAVMISVQKDESLQEELEQLLERHMDVGQKISSCNEKIAQIYKEVDDLRQKLAKKELELTTSEEELADYQAENDAILVALLENEDKQKAFVKSQQSAMLRAFIDKFGMSPDVVLEIANSMSE